MILPNHTRTSVATNLPAQHQRALRCGDADQRRRLLKRAPAEVGYIPAMHDHGLMCEEGARKRWLLEAASEGYVPAMYDYACWPATTGNDENGGCCWRPGTATSRRCTDTAWIATILPKPCTGCGKPPWRVITSPWKPAPCGVKNLRQRMAATEARWKQAAVR